MFLVISLFACRTTDQPQEGGGAKVKGEFDQDQPILGPKETNGEWQTPPLPPKEMRMQAIHSALQPDGTVLIANGSSNRNPANPLDLQKLTRRYALVDNTAVFDPSLPNGHGFFKVPSSPRPGQDDNNPDGADLDLFCSGHAHLPDGNMLFVGGTRSYPNNFRGAKLAWIFDWRSRQWRDTGKLKDGRWYPTLVPLPSGKIAVFSGLHHQKQDTMSTKIEVYNPFEANEGKRWSSVDFAGMQNNPLQTWGNRWDFYPRAFMMKDGRIWMPGDGSGYGNRDVNSRNTLFVRLDTNANPPKVTFQPGPQRPDMSKYYPSSVYDPTSKNGNILIFGGMIGGDSLDLRIENMNQQGFPRTVSEMTRFIAPAQDGGQGTFEVIQNALGNTQRDQRINHTAILLPTRQILVLGGGNSGYERPVFHPVLLTPDTTQAGGFNKSFMNPNHKPRLYHNNALLLPDGRVLSMGGNFAPGNRRTQVREVAGGKVEVKNWDDPELEGDRPDMPGEVYQVEIFSPPYLFLPGARPKITDAPETVKYGSAFNVKVQDGGQGGQLVMMRLGSNTHGMDVDQRHVPLNINNNNGGNGTFNVAAPTNRNFALPGYYMLFYINNAGKPSVSKMVRLE